MPIVTRLVATKRNPSRVSLYCDNQFCFALSLDEVVKAGLKRGMELSSRELEELKLADDLEKSYQKILNFISFRPRSKKEVVDRLKQYQVDSPNEILTRLTNHGYIDDLAFAKWFVESRLTHRPRSLPHLKAELRAKGLSNEIISKVTNKSQEKHSLKLLIEKKSTLPRVKLINYLSRKGFSYKDIVSQLDEMGLLE